MKRAVARRALFAGLWPLPSYAQTSQRLLSSLSAGLGNLDCAIAGPAVERLPWDDLLRSLEQGVEAIRSRHGADDGAPPVLRVAGGRPRIQPGGRLTLQRGARFIDDIWDGIGPADTAEDLFRAAGRFLDAGVIDDDADESIAVLERAVLTQAFAYAVNARIRNLCDPTGGAAVGRLAGDSRPAAEGSAPQLTESTLTEQASGGGVQTLGGSRRLGGQVGGIQRRPAPPRVEIRSRSMGRTLAGVGLMAGGALLVAGNYKGYCEVTGAFGESVWWPRDYGYLWHRYLVRVGGVSYHDKPTCRYDLKIEVFHGGLNPVASFPADAPGAWLPEVEQLRGSHEYQRFYIYPMLAAGVGMIGAGILFATVWSDVAATQDIAVNITPDGGVRASKSFGWWRFLLTYRGPLWTLRGGAGEYERA